MRWSIKIANVKGIKIYIHWTFLFLVAWILIANLSTGSTPTHTLYAVGFILAVFLCVVLHELGHALVAKHFHYMTRDIILLPIGGMARMDELPEKPRQEFLIAIMGPIVNFGIALILWPFIYWFGKIPTFATILFRPESTFLFDLFMVNVALGAFNLIPAFPMDGGRAFRALLARRMTRVRATEVAAHTGQAISIFFFFIGLFFNPMLTVIAIFIFLMAQAETEYVRSHSVLHDYFVKDVTMHKYYSLDSSTPITDAVKLLMDVQATDFLVTEHGNVVGTLSSQDVLKTITIKGDKALVLDAMKTAIYNLSPDTPLDKAYSELQANKGTILPVLENNEVIGIIDLNHILELIMVKEAALKSFRSSPNNQIPKLAA